MITELELGLHNGEITLFEYLEKKRMDLILEEDRPQAERWRRISKSDIAKGLTPRVRAYCRKQGLNIIPDLDTVWKKPSVAYGALVWKKG